MEKYGFVYIWYDRKRKMFYIGCHWGHGDDGYICSSRRMRDVYRRRPEDFKRRIISRVYTNRQDLLEKEHKWFQLIKPEELGKKYYNLRQHRWGHWSSDIESRKTIGEKVSKALKGRKRPEEVISKLRGRKLSEEHKEKIRQGNIGKKYSEETKEKMRRSALGKDISLECREKLRQANLGKKHSEESRQKMTLSKMGENNPFYGKKHSEETKEKLRQASSGNSS